jgi:cyclic beta-1,2-glucan synthetase
MTVIESIKNLFLRNRLGFILESGHHFAEDTIGQPFEPSAFTSDQLKEYAKQLAHTHETVSYDNRYYKVMLSNLKVNEKVLSQANKTFTKALQEDLSLLPPSTEWLLDNYYIVDDQVSSVKYDLTPGFYKDLPKLKSGPLRGFPRIYSIALELLIHSDNRLHRDTTEEFILTYESVSPLTSAELWAFPIMLRLVLIENLKRVMEKTEKSFEKHKVAKAWGSRLVNLKGLFADQIFRELEKTFKKNKNPDPLFLILVLRSLRDKDSSITPIINWLEKYIEEEDINLEEIVKVENQRQAAHRVTTGNIVTSMRLISSLDWSIFFETTSLVEKILRLDTTKTYEQMDFASRDTYRHVVENLSRYSRYNEQEVARRAIKLAKEGEGKRGHVGYYLVDAGLKNLKINCNYAPSTTSKLKQLISTHPVPFYLGSILSLTVIGVYLVSLFLNSIGITPFLSLFMIIPISVPAVSLINNLVTFLFPPNTPPKLELKEGVPDEFRTVVVIPCLIGQENNVAELISKLERRYLANRDKNILFALLTDFPDAPSKEMSYDAKLIEKVKFEIIELNNKYKEEGHDPFYLFHRERVYNEREKIWMGWERKRGKLEEFNRFLLGSNTTGFVITEGNIERIRTVKFVITLDADTLIPLNTARKMIGTIAHPLNRPVIDEVKRMVVEGYGIIQPKVDIFAPSATKTAFTTIFAPESGLDPYHSVISNVYQDLFHDATYIGKAIYDLAAFNKCIDQRFPSNSLLSHDLLEGNYLRVGLATDIELLEDFPVSYDSFSSRQHRWIRGDWQTLLWLFPFVRTANGDNIQNTLGLLEKWKIIDNLRRSLVVPTATLLIIAGFLIFPHASTIWTGLILIVTFFPLAQAYISSFTSTKIRGGIFNYFSNVWADITLTTQRLIISISFMPYETIRNINAIGHSLLRMVFKLKGILQWTSHAVAELKGNSELSGYTKRMYLPIVLSVGLFFWLIYSGNLYGIPLTVIILWLLSPLFGYVISQPIIRKMEALSSSEKEELSVTARKIWRFFDEMANEDNNYLPPDNLQVYPSPKIAKRTSPTNIGFLILSIISAHDFGFIDDNEFLNRIESVFATLDKLNKFNGHFFNWYQTDTLETMHPAYVSTVDSGNLASSLIVTKQACLEMLNEKRTNTLKHGLLTTITAWQEEWKIFKQITKMDKSEHSDKILFVQKIINKAIRRIAHIKAQIIKTEILNINQKLEQVKHIVIIIEKYEAQINNIVNKYSFEALTYWRIRFANYELFNTTNKSDNINRWIDLSLRAEQMVKAMDFKFLFDLNRKVFSIGYNTDENTLDDSYYNLLASEARLASFVAIALGQIPEKHWFDLGRPLKKIKGKPILLSWGGTIFEYLMPELFIRNFDNTLLSLTNYGILEKQIYYAKSKTIPWGISESGFYGFDFNYNYQYQQFGIPELSLKMVLSENLVVAPYASLLALSLKPKTVFENLKVLAGMGVNGTYGFYESVDFNPERIKEYNKFQIVKSYMSHHQGMSLVSINNYLNGGIMQSRFHRDGLVASVELLLSERIPQHIAKVVKSKKPTVPPVRVLTSQEMLIPKFSGRTETIKTTVLSNSEYSVVVTNGGSGYSSFKNVDITRWQIDTVENNWGWFCFVKDTSTNETWSSTYQPYLKKPDSYSVSFLPHKAEFNRVDKKIETKTTVTVSPDQNAEIREVSLTNKGSKIRKLEITDYAEVVGLEHRADAFHPALGKLFIESEYDSVRQALLFKRRIRKENQPELWIWHTLKTDKDKDIVSEYETNRENFIGRGHTILQAAAFDSPLQNFAGASLDPIMSLRTKIILKPEETKHLFYITGVASSKQEALDLIDKFSETDTIERTSKLAEIHSQIELRHLGIKTEEAREFQKLGSRVIYPDRYSRANPSILIQNIKGQSGLYPYGISGDYPIVLVKIKSSDGLKVIRQTLLAHEFLRMKNINFDLIILNEQKVTYDGDLKEAIQNLIDTSLSRPLVDKPGGIYLRDSAYINKGDQILFETIARIIIDSQLGRFEDTFDLVSRSDYEQSSYEFERKPTKQNFSVDKAANLSGFSPDGSEYVINFADGEIPPYPWSNVVASPKFGTLLTSTGLGYTWANNSQLNRITTWSNDPVTEKPGEIIFVRTDNNDGWWSATPLPVNNLGQYSVSHGWGYTSYSLKTKDMIIQTDVWVDTTDPVKIISVNITNNNLSVRLVKPCLYAELVMGDNREQNQFFVISEFDEEAGAVMARNSYNNLYPGNITFIMCSENNIKISADRMEFIGRGGSWSRPAYLEGDFENNLSGNVGAGLDPAIILESILRIKPGKTKQVTFIVGQAKNHDEYIHLSRKYKNVQVANESFKNSKAAWKKRLNIIQIKTPDTNLDTISNGWLTYQSLSGRFWGRTSFFQSGGAFGFRDQLQDMLALMYSDPGLVREHILYTAEHQFIQGDVMHWWHPDTTRGVRTKISDDFLWLPYMVSQYVSKTNDTGILDEKVSFMDMSPLSDDEIERYDSAIKTQEKSTLYNHCIRALENGMKTGKHGLPLVGSGDWNDGLNSVGEGGSGESVWLAWFQYKVYMDFSNICKKQHNRHDHIRFQRYAKMLKSSLEKHGWDGSWYRRAYFDDGSILGSKENEEAMIDSVSQTWSVISNASTADRAEVAIKSVEEHLVKQKEGLVLLLTPPFEKSVPFPGYIRGYIPGIRENGSQYTHAAVWLPLAYTKLGNGTRAVQLLDLLNPINHSDTSLKMNTYKAEPYVLAGDVYSHPQHIGRAGWSWYTGSAAWMYKIVIENIIGLTQTGNFLILNPCVPNNWTEFELSYIWKDTTYKIMFINPDNVSVGVQSLKLDSKVRKNNMLKMINDKKPHLVEVTMGTNK